MFALAKKNVTNHKGMVFISLKNVYKFEEQQIFRICGLKIKNNFALQELNRQFINQCQLPRKIIITFFNYCLDVKNQQLLKNVTIVLLTFKPFNEGSVADKY